MRVMNRLQVYFSVYAACLQCVCPASAVRLPCVSSASHLNGSSDGLLGECFLTALGQATQHVCAPFNR